MWLTRVAGKLASLSRPFTRGRVTGAPGAELLIQKLADADEGAREEAVRALKEIGAPALDALVRIARWDHPQENLRGWACLALSEVGDGRVAKAVACALYDPRPLVRQMASRAIGKMGGPLAVSCLIRKLGDRDAIVRRLACEALGRLGEPRAVRRLAGRLRDSDEAVRLAACAALAEIGAPAAYRLAGELLDRNENVKELAAQALNGIGAPAVDALIPWLRSRLERVSWAAGLALTKVGAPAVEPLIDLAVELDPSAKGAEEMFRRVGWILAQIGAPAADALFARLMRPSVHRGALALACTVLAEMKDPRAVERFTVYLVNVDAGARATACIFLGELRDARAVEPLLARLGDPEAKVRREAAEALGKLGDARAVEPLIARSSDKNHEDVRRTACEALGKLGDHRAVEALIERLGDPAPTVRAAAAAALHKLGEGQLAAAAIGALEGQPKALETLSQWAAQGDLRLLRPFLQLLAGTPAGSPDNASAEKAVRALCPLEALLCRRDLARFEHKRDDSGSRFACRLCGGYDDVLAGIDQMIAVLDEAWEEEMVRDGSVLRVNWLKRGGLFDFDRVEILRASEYEVERLCIVVGNDTDSFRQERYKKIPCLVAGPCEEVLHDNLRRTFGEVGNTD